MGQTCRLEFYVQKRPPDSGMVLDIVELMRKHGFSVLVDKVHRPMFGDWEGTRKYRRHETMTVNEVVAALVKEGGGSIPFAEEPFPISLNIFPLGGLGNQDRAKALEESENGAVPLGSIRLNWGFVRTRVDVRERFRTTIDLGKSMYRALKSIYGFFYIDEVWEPNRYNLIPTERNILNHGPRDVFPLNFWSKDVAEGIDWEKIVGIDDLFTVPMEDGGLMIHLAVDCFAEYDWDSLRETERLLEWRK